MALYIDPPLWPAHGTMFSHLISDHSLAELHAFAAAAGIPERAFDRDHYDIAEERYARLVAQGAKAVDGRQLTRVLIASGLRIPARRRSESLDTALLLRWQSLLPDTSPRAETTGRALLDRWAEPHRHYHGRTHLLAILEALETLRTEPPRHVLLAAWFHDAVYQGVAGEDEENSALLAGELLRELVPAAELAEVQRLIRLTASHQPELGDDDGALLCDADLSVLGSAPEDYARYLSAVRQDYAHIAEADFQAGRAAVVRQLLSLDPLYRSPKARSLWAANAQRNLSSELS
ncbi:putative metal-dependent HD superfamily phosphohydrolase [Psychromicrobium silvestre]|uniref:Putative metal-dependent HD superfamily phosphohydrolase n=1 Tax=Psychromicrobium silvestre TaxID=1645614 RepID=A0A7Y9LU55_9MICC|nr:DUF4031 domain-containing protein [Psychromicrobium silvestre]NYE95642.1 putative metal-dependent HD superfamily phosphohydrolase [Psychromicrobium silvestre]